METMIAEGVDATMDFNTSILEHDKASMYRVSRIHDSSALTCLT